MLNVKCANCGKLNNQTAKKCNYCGDDLPFEEMKQSNIKTAITQYLILLFSGIGLIVIGICLITLKISKIGAGVLLFGVLSFLKGIIGLVLPMFVTRKCSQCNNIMLPKSQKVTVSCNCGFKGKYHDFCTPKICPKCMGKM